MACQYFPDDQTLQLQTGAGKDDVIHLPSDLDRGHCERQEEEKEDHDRQISGYRQECFFLNSSMQLTGDDSRMERLDPNGCPLSGRKSLPSVSYRINRNKTSMVYSMATSHVV